MERAIEPSPKGPVGLDYEPEPNQTGTEPPKVIKATNHGKSFRAKEKFA
jgi:hypothetical protein